MKIEVEQPGTSKTVEKKIDNKKKKVGVWETIPVADYVSKLDEEAEQEAVEGCSSGVKSNDVEDPSQSQNSFRRPGQFHAAKTQVPWTEGWTAATVHQLNNDYENNEGLYYVADPFLPSVTGNKRIPATVRMNYAASRIDNLKFKAQRRHAISLTNLETACCNKCSMRFFMNYADMRQRISYVVSSDISRLPSALFRCPICKKKSRTDSAF